MLTHNTTTYSRPILAAMLRPILSSLPRPSKLHQLSASFERTSLTTSHKPLRRRLSQPATKTPAYCSPNSTLARPSPWLDRHACFCCWRSGSPSTLICFVRTGHPGGTSALPVMLRGTVLAPTHHPRSCRHPSECKRAQCRMHARLKNTAHLLRLGCQAGHQGGARNKPRAHLPCPTPWSLFGRYLNGFFTAAEVNSNWTHGRRAACCTTAMSANIMAAPLRSASTRTSNSNILSWPELACRRASKTNHEKAVGRA
ncbi:hypothetical protein IWZ01DRAFT_185568 [Phyllosticta capitalensis]